MRGVMGTKVTEIAQIQRLSKPMSLIPNNTYLGYGPTMMYRSVNLHDIDLKFIEKEFISKVQDQELQN